MTAGVAGHQHLGSSEEAEWVTAAVCDAIDTYAVDYGITCLAAGVDQIFAALLLEKDVPYSVIVPCGQYETTFTNATDIARYHTLLGSASSTISLPYAAPTQEAFWGAGQRVVDESDLLIAVWDGEAARGLGGTADVVAYALSRGTETLHIDTTSREVRRLR